MIGCSTSRSFNQHFGKDESWLARNHTTVEASTYRIANALERMAAALENPEKAQKKGSLKAVIDRLQDRLESE